MIEIEAGSTNVYEDLGLPDAAEMRVKATLAAKIGEIIKHRHLTQVQAAEIGVAAARQGITAGVQVAEQLAAQGVSQAEAQKGYATIADILPDATRLSDIYGTTLEGYDLGQAEQEVFNQLASAQRRRQKLTQREVAAFGGSSGINKTSLTTSSVGQF